MRTNPNNEDDPEFVVSKFLIAFFLIAVDKQDLMKYVVVWLLGNWI